MNTSSEIKIEKPKIIDALRAGFNTVANHISIIILPVLLDLFLWFGPIWRVEHVFKPLIDSLSQLTTLETPETAGMIAEYQTLWQETVAKINLAINLRTLPIGVPSLMVSKNPLINPIGQPWVFDLTQNMQVIWVWAAFLITGFFLGSLYFKGIADQVIDAPQQKPLQNSLQSFFQVLLMPVMLIIILVILSIPVLFLVTLLSLISPTIGQFMIFIAGLVILWILMPLIFTPHGIFLFKQNIIAAMLTSISIVRVSMSRTMLFILAALTLSEGLNYLWRIPPTDHWFLLVGILGHAFVVSAVIASSFHYYLDATKFTQTVMNINSNRLSPFKKPKKME